MSPAAMPSVPASTPAERQCFGEIRQREVHTYTYMYAATTETGPEVEALAVEGGCKATWKREFKLSWRKASLLKSIRWLSGFGLVGCQ